MIADLDGFTVYSDNAEAFSHSPVFKMTNFDRWYGSPTVRTSIADMPLMDGAFSPTRSYRGAKRMVLEGVTWASSDLLAVEQAWGRIAALSPAGGSMTLTVTDAAGEKTMRVWLDGAPTVLPFMHNAARFQIPLVATDPRKYGAEEEYETTPSGDSDFGLVFPLFIDGYLDFGDFTPSGLVSLTNIGTATTWPVFKARGTLTDGFQVLASDQVVEYSATVGLGQEVTLSPYAGGRATIGATDVTQNLTQADWPTIMPGETKEFVFAPLGSTDANARLSILIRPAYW